MFRKKKQSGLTAKKETPTTAGEPRISVRKQWIVGEFEICSFEGVVTVSALDFFLDVVGRPDLLNSVKIPSDLCPAIGNALLQAAQ